MGMERNSSLNYGFPIKKNGPESQRYLAFLQKTFGEFLGYEDVSIDFEVISSIETRFPDLSLDCTDYVQEREYSYFISMKSFDGDLNDNGLVQLTKGSKTLERIHPTLSFKLIKEIMGIPDDVIGWYFLNYTY